MSQAFLGAHANIIKQSRFFYEKLVDVAINNLEDDQDKLAILRRVAKLLEKTVKNERLVEDASGLVQPIQEELNNEEKDIKIENIKTEFAALIDSFENRITLEDLYSGDGELKEIRKLIAELQANDLSDIKDDVNEDNKEQEEEIRTTQQDLNLIDPISKMLMVNPVRHVPCGHVYERDSTLQMMKQRKRKGFRCPYMGCEYRKPINRADLEEALDYKREITRRKQAGTYTQSQGD